MEEARRCRRRADGAERAALNRSQQGGGSTGGCLYALQATIPYLTRSSLHRCFQRHCISRLPEVEGSKPKKAFKACPIGYFHIDIAEVWTAEGKLYMFVAIGQTSKFAFAELHERAARRVAADFLRRLIDAVPLQDPHGADRQRHTLHRPDR
jgi:hypothetical protein